MRDLILNNIDNCAIFCDFDGTISQADTVNELLKKHGNDGWLEIENIWRAGLIGSKECMEGQLNCIPSISDAEFNAFLDNIEMDPHFKSFIERVQARNIDFYIVSDGFSLIINTLLVKNNIFNVKIIANELNLINNKLVPSFPHTNEHCISKSGNCKCNTVKNLSPNKQKIYIGDGYSDVCAIKHADLIFAKKDLAEHCEKHFINYYNYNDFKDVAKKLFI